MTAKYHALVLMVWVLVCAGCNTTRSISNSGYNQGWFRGGELSDLDLLGVTSAEAVTDEELAATPTSTPTFAIQKGAQIVLIQSGAMIPDEAMQHELSKFLTVVPFNGQPSNYDIEPSFSRALRSAALKGGCEYIVCYWGILETQQKNLVTETASWTPFVGKFIPDEVQNMRIRLKMLLMDVRTGEWIILLPETDDSSVYTAIFNRRHKDQTQVARLKEHGYAKLAEKLATFVVE